MKTKPDPSLCDNCERAYTIEGGGAYMSGYGKEPGYSCEQRYCPKLKRTIHFSGLSTCDWYKPYHKYRIMEKRKE